jgi:hypothetical protein
VIGEERENLMALLLFVVVLLAFAVAEVRRGADSTEGVSSREWKRRLAWGGIL